MTFTETAVSDTARHDTVLTGTVITDVEANKAVDRRFVAEVLNGHDLGALDELVASGANQWAAKKVVQQAQKVQTAKVDARPGHPFQLALGFGADQKTAVGTAGSSAGTEFERTYRAYVKGWAAYDRRLHPAASPKGVTREQREQLRSRHRSGHREPVDGGAHEVGA